MTSRLSVMHPPLLSQYIHALHRTFALRMQSTVSMPACMSEHFTFQYLCWWSWQFPWAILKRLVVSKVGAGHGNVLLPARLNRTCAIAYLHAAAHSEALAFSPTRPATETLPGVLRAVRVGWQTPVSFDALLWETAA